MHVVDYITYAKFPPKLSKFSFDNDNYLQIALHQPTKMHDKYFKKCCTTQFYNDKNDGHYYFFKLDFTLFKHILKYNSYLCLMLLNIVTYLDETCNSLVTIAFNIPKLTSATTFMVIGIFGAKIYNDIMIFG